MSSNPYPVKSNQEVKDALENFFKRLDAYMNSDHHNRYRDMKSLMRHVIELLHPVKEVVYIKRLEGKTAELSSTVITRDQLLTRLEVTLSLMDMERRTSDSELDDFFSGILAMRSSVLSN